MYVFRSLANIGGAPTMSSPLQVDYFYKDEMGKVQALLSVVSHVAAISATVGAI